MRFLMKVAAVFDRFNDVLAGMSAALIAILTVFLSYEVINRLVLHRATVWLLEAAEFSLVYVCFLAAAWLLRSEGHVVLDVVVTRLKPKAQALLNSGTSVVGAITCLVTGWAGVVMTLDYIQIGYIGSDIILINTAFILGIVPVGTLLLFIQFVRRAYGFWGKWMASDREK